MKAQFLIGVLACALLPAGGFAADGPAAVKVRYIETDVPAAATFYARNFGFKLDAQSGPNFAMLSKGLLQLVLSPPVGPGGASQAMPNGQHPEPGGWNRIILQTSDLTADVARLRKAGIHFRNNITRGPGGAEILVNDPAGNPVELFQPG